MFLKKLSRLYLHGTRQKQILMGQEMATLFQKVRHCFRGLAKFPGLTAVALLSLAIGISANTSIFNTVNRLLLRPLPFYKDANRLVILWNRSPGLPASQQCSSWFSFSLGFNWITSL